MTTTIETRVDGRVGRILVNRPGALNALDLSMLRAIDAALEAWREEPHVHAVVVEGAGGRAFCAGGDIRAVRTEATDGDADAVTTCFATEYALNLKIARYPKPYVALIDGICMGGGLGISVHGAARVATEHALCAMPEAGIGIFPDIGATFFLPRLPGSLGMFLGLTSHRVAGADAVHAGLATHYVPRADMPALSAALASDGVAVLGSRAVPPPKPSFSAADRAVIDECFSADSVAAIIHRLQAAGGKLAETALDAMAHNSPSSLVLTFEALRAGADMTLEACLAAELRLMLAVTRRPDFAEGVRAILVDKDRSPRWSPATLDAVDVAAIRALVAACREG